MLSQLEPMVFYVILFGMGLSCLALAVVAHALLGAAGLGTYSNFFVLAVGSYGSLFGLDWLYLHAYISAATLTVDVWIMVTLFGATAAFLLITAIRLVALLMMRR